MNYRARLELEVVRQLRERVFIYEWEERPDLNQIQVCVDGPTAYEETLDSNFTVTVEHGRYVIAKFAVSGSVALDKPEFFQRDVGDLVERHCDLAALVVHHKLEFHFPKKIARVRGHRDIEKKCTYFTVRFTNGHEFEFHEADVESEMTIAKGIMVYDLPPL